MNIKLQIPHVLRARGFRLYLSNGKRLVDLWLNGGAAVLGHTSANLLRELKNTASRGLYAPFPHFTESRLLKALVKLFPGYSFRLYASLPEGLMEKFSHRGTENTENTEGRRSRMVNLWRPYTNPDNPFGVDDIPLFIPVLPGIQTWRDGLPLGLCIVAFQTNCKENKQATQKVFAETKNIFAQLPPNDALSPILLTIAARGIHNILAAQERAKQKLPRIEKALKEDSSIWHKQGIYLTMKKEPSLEEWDILFNKFFEAGFLLPPTPVHPLILPGELSDGEEAKLASVI